MTEWKKAVSESSSKPELVDMTLAVSTFMAIKDEEELVSYILCQTSKADCDTISTESDKDSGTSHVHIARPSYRAQVGDRSGQGVQNSSRRFGCSD